MRLAILALTALGSLALIAFSGPGPAGPSSSSSGAAQTFAVDPVHSNVLFKVMHNRASWFYGRFGELTGSFDYDAEDASRCSLLVEVRAASIDTRTEKLDQHLRSPDFFDAKQFPVILFKSTKVESGGDGMYRVTGDLMLHGVTKSMTIDVEHTGTGEGRGGETVLGFHTTFVIDRTEFGMSYGAGGPLGSEVELIVSIEAVQS